VGVGLDFPISSNLTAIADVFINPISSASSMGTEAKGMIAVAYCGVKYHVGDVMYFAGRAGYSWVNIDSKMRGSGSAVIERKETSPVANFCLGFESPAQQFVRPFGEINLVGMLGLLQPRWIATVTLGANFDL
jgi:hypothetical protein